MVFHDQLKVAIAVKSLGKEWQEVSKDTGLSPSECKQIYDSLSKKEIRDLIQHQRSILIKRLADLEEYFKLTRKYQSYKREDDKPKSKSTWQKTASMIWHKIADHRAGNLFLKPVKDAEYQSICKEPMCLESVKSRIRSKTITTTAEFHRDVLHVIANTVMYNQDANLYEMALELKDYTDSEMQNFLIFNP